VTSISKKQTILRISSADVTDEARSSLLLQKASLLCLHSSQYVKRSRGYPSTLLAQSAVNIFVRHGVYIGGKWEPSLHQAVWLSHQAVRLSRPGVRLSHIQKYRSLCLEHRDVVPGCLKITEGTITDALAELCHVIAVYGDKD
jgi:hypothetical protein